MNRAIVRHRTDDLPVVRPDVLVLDPGAILSAREAAERDGHALGYAQGLAESRSAMRAFEESARRDMAAALDALASALSQVDECLVAERRRLERAAAKLAFDVVESLLAHELKLAASPGIEAITRAVSVAPEHEGAVARLHPADVEVLEPRDIPDRITVVADPAIGRGSCLLEVAAGLVDAQIETALARVRGVLEEATRA